MDLQDSKVIKKRKTKHIKVITESINFNNLNEDCFREIFKHISFWERLKLSLVCKKWSVLIKEMWNDVKILEVNDDFIRNYVKIYGSTKKIKNFLKNVFKHFGIYLNTLTINGGIKDLDYIHLNREVLNHCKNIKVLKLIDRDSKDKDFSEYFLKLLFSNNNCNLRSIHLENIRVALNFLLEAKPHLIEEFRLINNDNFIDQKLITKDHYNHKLIDLNEFLSKLKNVKKIQLEYKYNDNYYNYIKEEICYESMHIKEMINALKISDCENIVELSIKYGNKAINDILELILKQKKLIKLELKATITDKQFLDSLPKNDLEVFHLDSCRDVSHYSFHKFKNLKVLRIFNTFSTCLRDHFILGLTKCVTLKEIQIETAGNLLTYIGEGYFNNFNRLKNLDTFSICLRNPPINKILIALGKCNNLKNLNISESDFTNVDINSLNLFINLTNLDVSRTNISNDALISVVRNLLKLEKLNVFDCKKVSNKLILSADKVKVNRKDEFILKIYYKLSGIKPEKLKINPTWILLEDNGPDNKRKNIWDF